MEKNKHDQPLIDFLKTRRSTKLAAMAEPGPSRAELQDILTIASRVPDHGKLCPWRFVVFEGAAREKFGDVLKQAYLDEDAQAAPAKLELEAERLLRAPCVIAVMSTPDATAKHPVWEQQMSAGAMAYNLCLAANAYGYGTNWLSEWMSFNKKVHAALGMGADDQIVGFIYIGTKMAENDERPRPDLKDIVSYWE